jgi:hypothetical protein
LVKSRHVRLNVILSRADDTLQMITLRVDITASIAAPVMEAPMRPGGFFATSQGNDAAFTQDLDLMCLLHKKVITVLCSLYAQLTLISIYKSLYYNDLSNYFRIKTCYTTVKTGRAAPANNIWHCVICRKKYSESKSVFMSYTVPAVYAGLAARIRKGAAFPGPANCGWSGAWEWSAAE